MSTSRMSIDLSRVLIAVIVLGAAIVALAAEPPAKSDQPSKEMREKMAVIHENMASCLRSDRPFEECRQQMHTNCSNMMGAQGCPMMGTGMHGRMMPPQQQ